MSCICNHFKLPKMDRCEILKCVKISMDNGENYTIKVDDLVAIQFIKNDKQILIRRGRIKDIVVINTRYLHTKDDNVSHIILDCSEQFSIKIIEIGLKDIIKIGKIDDVFEDYNDRIEELEPNFIEENKIPIRQGGIITKQEWTDKITKPDKEDVVKMDSQSGEFNDLQSSNNTNIEKTTQEEESKSKVFRGMRVMM